MNTRDRVATALAETPYSSNAALALRLGVSSAVISLHRRVLIREGVACPSPERRGAYQRQPAPAEKPLIGTAQSRAAQLAAIIAAEAPPPGAAREQRMRLLRLMYLDVLFGESEGA